MSEDGKAPSSLRPVYEQKEAQISSRSSNILWPSAFKHDLASGSDSLGSNMQAEPCPLIGTHHRSNTDPSPTPIGPIHADETKNHNSLNTGHPWIRSFSNTLETERPISSHSDSIFHNLPRIASSSQLVLTPTTETLARRMNSRSLHKFSYFASYARSDSSDSSQHSHTHSEPSGRVCTKSSSLRRPSILQEYNLNNKENDKHIESNRCTDELRTNGAAAAKSQAEPSEPLSASHRTASRMSLASATSECSFNQDLVSRLPKIPDIAPERTVETGMSLPVGGSKHINPHNYISRPAYFETEDSPLYAMSEQSRRAANAAIQSMFDPLFPIVGLNGQIPEGFPVFGFAMREMKSSQLEVVLHAYGFGLISGMGYAIDRQNMSLICQYIGAEWLAAVI